MSATADKGTINNRMPTQLIVTADDFGASSAVNRAVALAHSKGALTSASLMVTGGAAGEAVSMARDSPGLAVGLHLALSRARSVLPPERISSLVNAESRFPASDVRAALRWYLDPSARGELAMEIEAQFAAFAETGLPLSHVDGHQHLHAHPAVLPAVIEHAVRYGAAGIRVPREPFARSLSADRSRPGYKIAAAVGHALLAALCRRRLAKVPLARCDMVIGALMSGRMSTGYVCRMLEGAACSSVEVFFHPADLPAGTRPDGLYGPNREDLSTLLSPALRQTITDGGFEPTTYAGLRFDSAEAADERS